ncbi:phosphate-selective porin O and P [delta proteobacterium NaphS2]|nr:phosphate-selective porin O and P [delta proteobacterium NaphS2]
MKTPTKWGAIAACLALCILCVWPALSLGEEKGGPDKTEDSIWLPSLELTPSDQDSNSGYLPIIDRDIHFKWGMADLRLSKRDALEVSIEKAGFYLRVGGRILVDWAHYFEEKNNMGNRDIGLRTLMIEGNGRFSSNWTFRLSVGGLTEGGRFNGSGAFLDDAYVSYNGIERTSIIFGQQMEPFSLEEMNSGLAITFMERALPNALVPGSTVGLSAHTYGNSWSTQVGLFSEDLATQKDQGNLGTGFNCRAVYNPLLSEKEVYHVGGSFSFRKITGGDTVYFRYRPESGLTNVRYVDTGDIPGIQTIGRLGIEGATVLGPLSFQAEYIGAFVDREDGLENLKFHGWYAFVSWFPTGETRRYLPQKGTFGYPQIESEYGAVELAARYSAIDLTSASVRGGKEQNVAFGANWYITPRIRLMANCIFVFAGEDANGNGTLIGDDRPRILQVRFQMQF